MFTTAWFFFILSFIVPIAFFKLPLVIRITLNWPTYCTSFGTYSYSTTSPFFISSKNHPSPFSGSIDTAKHLLDNTHNLDLVTFITFHKSTTQLWTPAAGERGQVLLAFCNNTIKTFNTLFPSQKNCLQFLHLSMAFSHRYVLNFKKCISSF